MHINRSSSFPNWLQWIFASTPHLLDFVHMYKYERIINRNRHKCRYICIDPKFNFSTSPATNIIGYLYTYTWWLRLNFEQCHCLIDPQIWAPQMWLFSPARLWHSLAYTYPTKKDLKSLKPLCIFSILSKLWPSSFTNFKIFFICNTHTQ